MADIFQLAEKTLLHPLSLDERSLSTVLEQVLMNRVDYADIYLQSTVSEYWFLEDSFIKEVSFDKDQGIGVRALSGEKTGFAHSDELTLPALMNAASAVRGIARQGATQSVGFSFRKPISLPRYAALNPIDSLLEKEKALLLQTIDRAARAIDPRVERVMITLAGEHDTMVVLNSEGELSADVRPMMRLDVTVVAASNGRRERGHATFGGRMPYMTLDNPEILALAHEAVRQALINLEAIEAPAGMMPVVLGPGWPGVLLHEAVGHGLEGDFNRKGSSIFSDRIGEQVASPLCTVVDDGTLEDRRGSLSMDDEGVPTQSTVLIENGILKGYMQDRLNARLMKTKPTGNGRRESYACVPMPRMTNTFMRPGTSTPDEIIASVKKGLYAVNFSGGQVDITSGKFVFTTSEAYLIENGKITTPVRGATLIGNGPDVMQKITMVGNDLQWDKGSGICGKEGQSVPVTVGQPTLKIRELTVGGTTV